MPSGHGAVLAEPSLGCFGRGGALGPFLHPGTGAYSTVWKVEMGHFVPPALTFLQHSFLVALPLVLGKVEDFWGDLTVLEQS